MLEVLGNLGAGLVSAVQPVNFLRMTLGLAIGIVAGALPGITMLNAIVLVLPFTCLMGIMRRWDLPVPPLVMGVILGPMAEQYFLTSMVSNANVVSIFVTRPVSAVMLLLSAVMVLWPIGKARRRTS